VTDISVKYQDIINRRADFPSLNRVVNDLPLAYFDGPGGTQVPQQVIDAISGYYTTCNANVHGGFITSMESDEIIQRTRETAACFLGAPSWKNISFGHNMTTLNFALSRAIGTFLKAGDEILITQLDHESNRGPWIALEELGIVVREVIVKADGTLDYQDFEKKINERTRLVAMGYSSNGVGTVNDIKWAREMTYRVGAWLLVDAVHYAPHFPLDVTALGIDFLLCSAYKFYGPHIGILYSKTGLLDRLPVYNLRTQDQHAPFCIETGTLNFAALAGVNAAIEYIASLGRGETLRQKIVSGMTRIGDYEDILAMEIYHGLDAMEHVIIQGPSPEASKRAPTISFTMKGHHPETVCRYLGEKGICSWDGDFYAVCLIERLGLHEHGGVIRVGVSLYNTMDEVKRLLAAVEAFPS
jgi:cysteine desulfurase family protein (TIGR01976 family)